MVAGLLLEITTLMFIFINIQNKIISTTDLNFIEFFFLQDLSQSNAMILEIFIKLNYAKPQLNDFMNSNSILFLWDLKVQSSKSKKIQTGYKVSKERSTALRYHQNAQLLPPHFYKQNANASHSKQDGIKHESRKEKWTGN